VDVESQVEDAIRAYFAASGAELEERSAGVIRELFAATRELDDPATLSRLRVAIRRLEIVALAGDRMEVVLDATVQSAFTSDEGARDRETVVIDGPATFLRVDGAWRVADYTRNGRPRSESIQLRPSGTQEVGGLRVSALAADLQADRTLIYLKVANRHGPIELDWGALGVRTGRRWRYHPLGVSPNRLPTGDTVAGAWSPKAVPLESAALRVIVVPKGERVGFDFIVGLAGQRELEDLQSSPKSLPLRLRVVRSPLVAAVPLLGLLVVFILGGWSAGAVALFALGVLILCALAWHRLRGRRVGLRRPVAVGAGLAGAGAVLFLATGTSSGGCPPQSEAGPAADRFVKTLLTRGPDEADDYVASYAGPVRESLPSLPPVPQRRANEVVRTRTLGLNPLCNASTSIFPETENAGPCFVYDLPTSRLTVYLGCDAGEWKVTGIERMS